MLKAHHHFMWNFTRSFIKSLKRPVFVYLITLSFTLQILFSALFFHFEQESNVDVGSFFDSLYYTVSVMTGVGLGDIHPVTFLGKVVSMMMMLAGTAIFVSFTGVLAASILQIETEHIRDKNKSSLPL
jgi:voltage-gated potassium channel